MLRSDNLNISYELHAQAKGRWSIVRVFDGASKDSALTEAHNLYAESLVTDVKVVRETYDPESNETSDMVIYDTTRGAGTEVKVKMPAGAKGSPPDLVTHNLRADDGVRQLQMSQEQPQNSQELLNKSQEKPSSITGIAVLGVVLVTAAAILLFVLSRVA